MWNLPYYRYWLVCQSIWTYSITVTDLRAQVYEPYSIIITD